MVPAREVTRRTQMSLTVSALISPTLLAGWQAHAGIATRRPFRECLGVSCHFPQGMPLSIFGWLSDMGVTWIRDAFDYQPIQYTLHVM